jgi:ABC-type Zn2+ transport system substrate-binding protein/surface adhesin
VLEQLTLRKIPPKWGLTHRYVPYNNETKNYLGLGLVAYVTVRMLQAVSSGVMSSMNSQQSPITCSDECELSPIKTITDKDNHHHETKRSKHIHHHSGSQQSNATHHQHRRNNLMREVSVHRKRRLITHYVLQLGL